MGDDRQPTGEGFDRLDATLLSSCVSFGLAVRASTAVRRLL